MKRSIFSLPLITASIALSFLVMSTSCKKSSSGGTPTGLTGSFGGTAFQPSLVVGIDASSVLEVAALQIKGGDSVGVLIAFPDDSPVSTPLDFTQAEIAYNDSKDIFDFESDFSPSHGTVKITSWDKTGLKIAGTYSGVIYDYTGHDSVVVTNGTFNTTYKTF